MPSGTPQPAASRAKPGATRRNLGSASNTSEYSHDLLHAFPCDRLYELPIPSLAKSSRSIGALWTLMSRLIGFALQPPIDRFLRTFHCFGNRRVCPS